jgi:hypothetical protein
MRSERRAACRRLGVLVAAAVVLGSACQRPQHGGDDLDTVEVRPAPESTIEVKDDVQAPEKGTTGLTGVVPADFPSDVPLYSPASITDFGRTPDGRRQLTFATSSAPDDVRARLVAGLLAHGWGQATAAGEDTMRFEKDGRTVRLQVHADPVGAVYRVEY